MKRGLHEFDVYGCLSEVEGSPATGAGGEFLPPLHEGVELAEEEEGITDLAEDLDQCALGIFGGVGLIGLVLRVVRWLLTLMG